MSTVAEQSQSAPSRAPLIGLLKEYCEKVRKLIDDARTIREKWDNTPSRNPETRTYWSDVYSALEMQHQQLAPVYQRLDRRVSQYLEHAEVDDLERIEIETRLAEFGVLTRSAQDFMAIGRPH